MALSFLVICEAKADYLTSSELADRVLCEFVEWIEPDILDSVREYVAPPGDERFLTWK